MTTYFDGEKTVSVIMVIFVVVDHFQNNIMLYLDQPTAVHNQFAYLSDKLRISLKKTLSNEHLSHQEQQLLNSSHCARNLMFSANSHKH